MGNIIGIDISKTSTAIVVKCDNSEHYFSYNTHKSDYIWNKRVSHFVTVRNYKYDNSISDYSSSEIDKLKQYSAISIDIINDLLSVANPSIETIIRIEGYSFGKSTTIIDIAGISAAVRVKIIETYPNAGITILAPTSLKSAVAGMVYGYDYLEIGGKNKRVEKIVKRNPRGIAGGSLEKKDMLLALKDFNGKDMLSKFVIENFDLIDANKDVPKPIEDLIDALMLTLV